MSSHVKIVILALASIALMMVDHKNSYLEILRSSISTLVYPLQHTAGTVTDLPRKISAIMVSRQELMEENQRLREEQLHMYSRLQRTATLEGEIRRLRALLESSVEFNERVLVAELVGVELEAFRQQIVVNKGTTHGVFIGQPVVDAGGIMGQVIHVSPFSSTVLLITDLAHSIPALVNRNGLRSVATGLGEDNIVSLEHIPVNADIKEGDKIVSSGLGGRFPRGYPVGTVASVTRVPGELFSTVLITPSAKFGETREALLVWPDQPTVTTSDVAMRR
ncbi:MAG: rod shape-determining protein MreC [Gammaproteobacteria bacterium]|nr:rod shape-determining protein MreC [Gammaproteobacteria bacterium]MDE0286494.1 rod shape-determining protein MreC [Gammaproteobacteria bacterium]MDE0511536.1 rod shape-determining protein MreC [Gammaproteobacteria bacterium]